MTLVVFMGTVLFLNRMAAPAERTINPLRRMETSLFPP